MAVNMAAMMADADARKYIDDVQHEMEKDETVNRMMDAAASIEDLFEVAKKYVVMKFEDFKAICNDAFDYFGNKKKVALSDDTMEMVIGGSWLGDVWNKCKKVVTAVAVGVVVAAATVGAVALMATTGGLALGAAVGVAAAFGGAAGVSAGMLQYMDNAFIKV